MFEWGLLNSASFFLGKRVRRGFKCLYYFVTFLWSPVNIANFWIVKVTCPRPSPKYPQKEKGEFGLSQSTTCLFLSMIAVLVTSQPLCNLISCVVRWAESLLLETETGTGVLSAPGSLGNCCHGPTLAMSSYLEVTLFILCVQCTYLSKIVFLFGANMDQKYIFYWLWLHFLKIGNAHRKSTGCPDRCGLRNGAVTGMF